jgi:hypothetical protein
MENIIEFTGTPYAGLAEIFLAWCAYMLYTSKARQSKREAYQSGYTHATTELDNSSNKRLTYDNIKSAMVQDIGMAIDVPPYWRGVSAALKLYSPVTGQRLKGRKAWKV